MAKIEFSAKELESMKQIAEAYKKGGDEQAQKVLEQTGFRLEISPEVREAMTAAPESGKVNSDNCFACFACLIIGAATLSLMYVTD